MRLTYWVSEALADSSAYNLRARTKREIEHMLDTDWNRAGYGPVHKVSIDYDSGFELLVMCLGEQRIYEGV